MINTDRSWHNLQFAGARTAYYSRITMSIITTKPCSILYASLIAIASFLTTVPARADTVKATCTYTLNHSNEAEVSMPCFFYQSQGHIVLTWDDGVVSDFMPEPGQAMVYRDQNGGIVYRRVGKNGTNRFKMENGTISVLFGQK